MKDRSIIGSIIIGIAIIITAMVLAGGFKNRNATLDSISVTGLGTKDFESDEILWSGRFGSRAMVAKEAYDIITSDKEKVRRFFTSKGFAENEFSFGGVAFEKTYRTITIDSREGETRSEQVFDGYTATQSVSFFSKKNPALMKKIENVIDQTSELINSGIEFNPAPVQYTYSDLPSLKHNLIENGSKDAGERARKIVENAGGKLGKLKTASMGVFQITGKGSVEEDSFGGNNDTYSKSKTARITVRLEYGLE